MSSVRNFLRRQTDVEQQTTRHYQPHNLVNFERPLSEYDNLSTITSSSFPLSDIKFQFDVLPSVKMSNNNNNNSISSNSSSVHYNNINNNNNSNKETSPVQLTSNNIPQYENVFETVQMRNSLARKRDLEQVKSSEINGNKSAMNDARSTFFGLTHAQQQQQQHDKKPDTNDETDNVNVNNMQSDQINYINLVNNDSSDLNKISPSNSTSNANANQTDKMSATSSASNSSSTTITPQASPYRQNRVSRKGSEASNRSKSPKFMLPEIATNTPSQAVYMATTVPQNIKGQNIMGRHKPTRNSLRHSRMIVTNKSFHDAAYSNSLNIKHILLAKIVLILKIVVGLCMTSLGIWICLFANSTPISQNPFWSGLIIIVSGSLGLFLLSFKKIRSSKIKAKFFWFLKMNACVIIIMSVFLTTLAFIYESFHFFSLTNDNKKCYPENIFVNSSSCICIFNIRPNSTMINGHTDTDGHLDFPDNSNTIHFRDLSCNELTTWTYILLASMILNFIGLVLSVCYMTQFIFGCKRRKISYLSVRTTTA